VERVGSGREFRSGEKKGCEVGTTKRGKGTEWMAAVDGRSFPLGKCLHSASPAEIKIAETTLATIRVGRNHRAYRPRQKMLRVIDDNAYDSDPLANRLRQREIELIWPHNECTTWFLCNGLLVNGGSGLRRRLRWRRRWRTILRLP